jgi:hypothetical protein
MKGVRSDEALDTLQAIRASSPTAARHGWMSGV